MLLVRGWYVVGSGQYVVGREDDVVGKWSSILCDIAPTTQLSA